MMVEKMKSNQRLSNNGGDNDDDDDRDNDEENVVIDLDDEDEDCLNNNNNNNTNQLEYSLNDVDYNQAAAISVFNNNNNTITSKNHNLNQQLKENSENLNDTHGTTSMKHDRQFLVGDLVWFDPNNLGYHIPGKVIDYLEDLNLLTIEGYAQPALETTTANESSSSNDDDDLINNYNKQLLEADQTLQVYNLTDFSSLKLRLPLTNEFGLIDLVELEELSQESIIWNLKLRYKQELIYTKCGHKILISVNPFKQLHNIYNLDQVNRYDTINSNNLESLSSTRTKSSIINTSLIRWLLLNEINSKKNKLVSDYRKSDNNKNKQRDNEEAAPPPPHIFGLVNEALKRLLISGQDQCFILLGESGSGKTEASKLLIQYLATVNKAPTNLMTEQILESIQVLESFGNAKTILNDNSSRFGKLLDVRFNLTNGFITNAKTIDLNLLDRTRIVSQVEGERNYHIFYELLAGLSKGEKEKYGLQTAEKYFYLNQGHCVDLPSKEDGDDFRSLLSSMQVLGFNYEEQDTIFRLLASILHLGNIYFNRKVLAIRSGKLAQQQQKLTNNNNNNETSSSSSSAGVEGVEIGSDTEVRWVSHLLQIQFDSVMRCLTVRTTETTSQLASSIPGQANQLVLDRIITPLNIDQALDTRDAIARALYTCLFKWLVQRINVMINVTSEDNSTRDANNNQDQLQHSNQAAKPINTNKKKFPFLNEPIYLCQTSESLCEFQPDRLTTTTTTNQADSSCHSSLARKSTSNYSTTNNKLSSLQSATITILDAFGFENLSENNFEQLCINYTAELLHYHTTKYLLRLEQAEYARERLKWIPIQSLNSLTEQSTSFTSSTTASSGHHGGQHPAAIVNLISKKPLGILALLDDECNFPKATDQSFAEKCHHNHTLNDNYQRPRLATNNQEFGIKHFRKSNRLIWYQVEGFIEKNRDSLRPDILDLLAGSKATIFTDMLRKLHQTSSSSGHDGPYGSATKTLSRTYDGRYVTMKPRATSVAAKFQDALHNNKALESINYNSASSMLSQLPAENAQYNSTATEAAQHQQQQQTLSSSLPIPNNKPNPWFIVCLKPNRSKTSQVFDVAFVQDQLNCLNLLELTQMRKFGYPVRMRYGEFVRRYKCLVPQKFLNNLTSCQNIQAANQRLINGGKSSQAHQALMSNGEIKRAIRDVCSAIVEYRFTNHSNNSCSPIKSQYQCGLTKMFLNEKLYNIIEQLRLIEHQRAILILQKTLRMWLLRREFLLKKQATIVIQAQVRAYLCRREFWRQYLLIVQLQRHWRQCLINKRRKMLEARRKAQRQQQQHQLQELQAQQRKQANQFRHRIQPNQLKANLNSANGAYANHSKSGLDIPDDLAQLYRLQKDWLPVHELNHLNELNLSELIEREERRRSKHDGNYLSVPFVALEEDSSSDGMSFFEIKSISSSKSNRITIKSYLTRNLLMPSLEEIQLKTMDLVQKLELMNEQYNLQNFIMNYYTTETPQFGYSRLPITRAFNRKIGEKVNCQKEFSKLKAIAIYKLILRYIDSDLSGDSTSQQATTTNNSQATGSSSRLIKFKLLADYVIYLCLNDPLLQDEIYLQLASQSWQNPRAKSGENVWKLMLNCASCFLPTNRKLLKHLICFTNDYCVEKYRQLLLNRFCEPLISNNEHNNNFKSKLRNLPPTMLEYWANQQGVKRIALAASCYMDDHALNGPIQASEEQPSLEELSTTNHSNKTLVQLAKSSTTAEQLAGAVLRSRQVPLNNLCGWSVEIQHEGGQSEFSCRLRGDDKLLDHLTRVELLPNFTELIDETNENLKLSLVEQKQNNNNDDNDNELSLYYSNYKHRPPMGNFVNNQDHHHQMAINHRHSMISQRSLISQFNNNNNGLISQRNSRVLSDLDLSAATRLSQTSKLNRRYILHQQQQQDYANQDHHHHHQNYAQGRSGFVAQNRRDSAQHDDLMMQQQQQQQQYGMNNRRSMSMQELQLASSALNGRYFHQSNQQQFIFNQESQLLGANGEPPHYAATSSYIGSPSSSSSNNNNNHNVIKGKGVRRRSQTPNSIMMSASNRMSSSAYGSNHGSSSAYAAAANNYNNSSHYMPTSHHSDTAYSSDFIAHNHQPPMPMSSNSRTSRANDRRGHPAAAGSLTRSGALAGFPPQLQGAVRARRSASSSSRTPSRRGGGGSDYASAYSDYERIGYARRSGYAYPPSGGAPVVARVGAPNNHQHYGRSSSSSSSSRQQHMMIMTKPQNPLIERYKQPASTRLQHQQQQLRNNGKIKSNKFHSHQQQPLAADANVDLSPLTNQQQQHYVGSSAMSDTSEAPSLASHVRGIKVPQHNGDLDQYLDDLFNPLLDEAELDEMSDARSLVTLIRGGGGGDDDEDEADQAKETLDSLLDAKCLSKMIRGSTTGEDLEIQLNQEQLDQERSETLSPTFESLLQSLRNEPLTETIPDQQSTTSSSGATATGTTKPMLPELSGLNLRELKALNEKLESEIQVAQLKRPSLELIAGEGALCHNHENEDVIKVLTSAGQQQQSSNNICNSAIPAPPPQPNFGGHLPEPLEDIYSRAKTIRIGKWRWPPASQEVCVPDGAEATSSETKQIKSDSCKGEDEPKDDDCLVVKQPPTLEPPAEQLVVKAAAAASKSQVASDPSPLPNTSQTIAVSSVGRLKISSEMKAKLEQLTNTTGSSTSNNNNNSAANQSSSGIVSQVKSLLLAAENSRLNEQHHRLSSNENNQLQQISNNTSQTINNSDTGNNTDQPARSSKILAAKQQLAAAAGVALAALDNNSQANSQASSRRQSAAPIFQQQQSSVADGSSSSKVNNAAEDTIAVTGNERRSNRIYLQDELGPQSRSAISQRQAFYQMSASSDQLDQKHPEEESQAAKQQQTLPLPMIPANSELQLNKRSSGDHQSFPPPPPMATVSSDNLDSAAAATTMNDLQQQPGQLVRSMQMSSNLNEAGKNSELGIESDRLYQNRSSATTALMMAKSMHGAGGGGGGNKSLSQSKNMIDQHQWVSSSPDPTLESVGRRSKQQVNKSSAAKGNNIAVELQSSNNNKSRAHQVFHEQEQQQEQEQHQCLVYANVDWQIKIRKEFFLPSETYDDLLVVQLIFAQLVADVFNPRHWTRLNNKERAAIKALMKDNSIGYSPSLPQIGQLQAVKRDLVKMARSFGLYFTRSYLATNFALTHNHQEGNTNRLLLSSHVKRPNSSQSNTSSSSSSSTLSDVEGEEKENRNNKRQALKLMQRLQNAGNLGLEWLDMVAVHHSGLRLVSIVVQSAADQQQQQQQQQQNQPPTPSGYKVLETLKYRDMTDVSQVGNNELLVSMRNGKKCWLISSSQATQLGSLLKCFHADYNNHLSSTTTSSSKPTTTSQNNNNNNKTSLQRTSGSNNRRANKDALLDSNNDHHGDHLEQRQTSNSFGKLHSAPDTNNDLVNGERVLSDNLANIRETNKQQQVNSINNNSRSSSSSNKPSPASSTFAASASPGQSSPAINKSITTKPQSAAPISSPDGAFAPANPIAHNEQPPSGVALINSGESSKKKKLAATNNQHKPKNSLWQNSLSRMSNKFSIFGGSQSRNGNSYQSGNNNNNNNDINQISHHHKQSSKSAPIAGGDGDDETNNDKLAEFQPALDAWIETKVDFDEDEEEESSNFGSSGRQQDTSNDSSRLVASAEKVNANSQLDDQSSSNDVGSVRSKQSIKVQQQQQSSIDGKAEQQQVASNKEDGKYSLLQFALYNFREAIDKYSLESRASKTQLAPGDTSTLKGSLKLIETLRRSDTNSGSGTLGSSNNKDKRTSRLLLSNNNNNNNNSSHNNGNKATSATANVDNEWTWRELAEMVKFTRVPLKQSLLKLPNEDLSRRAVDCFMAIMQYMGDIGPENTKQQHLQDGEVECVYLILMNCHNYPLLRDEIYCQLMKQTTNNRSEKQDSCLKGWRLFSIIAAYFDCSQLFKPYLFKYLETVAYDKRRAYCSVALFCLQNLRKTFKYGGRKNVPSIEEIAATSAGRNSKRQIYRLPGGTERVINTKSTTVVDDIIHEICLNMLNVTNPDEMLEFSLYCIADGDLYTMPLNRDEYILDITTELIKNHQQYFLIFCRSIWHYPLHLDSKLYIEVIFNQIAPDYLEGLLLVLPNLRPHRHSGHNNLNEPLRLKTKLVKEIARIAALLHRASSVEYMPATDEIKFLLPKPIVNAMKQYQRNSIGEQSICSNVSGGGGISGGNSTGITTNNNNQDHTQQEEQQQQYPIDTVVTTQQKWIELVQNNWRDMSAFDTLDAKAQFLDIVRHWPLFGSSFFAIKLIQRDLIQPMDFILALNKFGIQMLDMISHETHSSYPFNEVISTRKVRSEDGALFLDLKCGNLMKRTIIRIQTDQAHEISRLIKQYIDIELLQQKQQQQQQQQLQPHSQSFSSRKSPEEGRSINESTT